MLLSPLGNGGTLWSSIWTNFTQGCFVLSMVEIDWLVLERKIFEFVNVFSLFRYYYSLGKGQGPSFEQSWLPFSQGWFLLSSVEIDLVVLEKKIFKICLCIFAIFLLSPLGKEWDSWFKQIWLQSFVPSLVEIGSGDED